MLRLSLIFLLSASSANAACTIDGTVDGAISVFSTLIFPSSAGSITITNDSPGTHTVTIPAITSLVAPVQGTDISGNLTMNISVSGSNGGSGFGGSDSTARTLLLANSGTDVVSISVQGNLNQTARAGTYTVSAAVNCT